MFLWRERWGEKGVKYLRVVMSFLWDFP